MQRVTVTYHREAGTWWADSEDVPGYTAVADALGDLRALVFEGIPFALEHDDIEIDEALENGARLMPGGQPVTAYRAPVPVGTSGVGLWSAPPSFDPWAHLHAEKQPA